MVRLSGPSLRDAQHLNGDLEIVCTGLGPGQKLYEELLIDAESDSPEQLWPQIEAVEAVIRRQNASAGLVVLA